MTRLMFGVSASSYAANMVVRQNAMDFGIIVTAQKVYEAFYVNDGLTGADSILEASKTVTRVVS